MYLRDIVIYKLFLHGSILQVVNFTFADQRLFFDPNATVPTTLVPDQVTVLPNSYADVTAEVYLSEQDYYSSSTYGLGVGDSWTIQGAALSGSTTVQYTFGQMNNGEYAYASAYELITVYEAQLSAVKPVVTDAFRKAVDGLQTQADYDKFVSLWGTHVMVSATIGGRSFAFVLAFLLTVLYILPCSTAIRLTREFIICTTRYSYSTYYNYTLINTATRLGPTTLLTTYTYYTTHYLLPLHYFLKNY